MMICQCSKVENLTSEDFVMKLLLFLFSEIVFDKSFYLL